MSNHGAFSKEMNREIISLIPVLFIARKSFMQVAIVRSKAQAGNNPNQMACFRRAVAILTGKHQTTKVSVL
jgi:hypothetical protein